MQGGCVCEQPQECLARSAPESTAHGSQFQTQIQVLLALLYQAGAHDGRQSGRYYHSHGSDGAVDHVLCSHTTALWPANKDSPQVSCYLAPLSSFFCRAVADVAGRELECHLAQPAGHCHLKAPVFPFHLLYHTDTFELTRESE